MLLRRSVLLTAMAAGTVVSVAAPAIAHDTGAHAARTALLAAPATAAESSKAMTFVKNVPHKPFIDTDAQNGSDIEFVTVNGRDYALAGTLRNGMQITDITDPANATRAAVYDCSITQGDIQVFRNGGRILATYTADAAIAPRAATGTRTAANEKRFGAACVTEANALGAQIDGSELGTFLVDLTDPTKPTTVSFIEIPRGSHNQTVHPSGDFLYNSNSDLIVNSPLPQITIHDISNPAKPVFVQDFKYLPGQPALGEESHDIFFNATGTRAYVASLGSTLILDTTDPAKPKQVSQFIDPANSLVHQSDVVSLPRKDGTTRDMLVTTDEQAGAAQNASCPGGGLHIYDITGAKEKDPLRNKIGTWFMPSMKPVGPEEACTSHVLRMHPDQGLMTIAWYTAGVRVLDISGLAEAGPDPDPNFDGNGAGMKEIGNFVFPDSDTWSFKTNRISADGSFFGYGNDLARGLDIYRFDGAALGRTVPPLEPEDIGTANCDGVPVATAYVDRDQARAVHQRAVDCVIARSIAQGSVKDGQKVYRPLEDVTRGQMATFILNTLRASGQDSELPAPKTGAFDDIATSTHRNAIEVLAAAGIVQGTTGGKSYNPLGTVTREQMASFMVRAAQFAVEPDLAETGTRRFTDVPDGGIHSANVAIGDDNGLFTGTSATTFSPTVFVKRDQMASFLTNLLKVAGGGSATPSTGTSTAP